MRLFIAVDLPDVVKEWASQRQKDLQRFLPDQGLRWMPSEQWHVTLRFLGEYPERASMGLLAAMKRVSQTSSFDFSLGNLGTFCGPRMGVLWLGAQSGQESLSTLASDLDQQLVAEKFPHEKRPFRAHVTLARSRVKISAGLLRGFPAAKPCPGGVVDQIHLYQSVLEAKGSRYVRLHTVRLAAKDERD